MNTRYLLVEELPSGEEIETLCKSDHDARVLFAQRTGKGFTGKSMHVDNSIWYIVKYNQYVPGGLQKTPAEVWEAKYWENIKRYPEINKEIWDLKLRLAGTFQRIKELKYYIHSFTNHVFRFQSQLTKDKLHYWFDIKGMQDKIVRQSQYLDSLKEMCKCDIRLSKERFEDLEDAKTIIEMLGNKLKWSKRLQTPPKSSLENSRYVK